MKELIYKFLDKYVGDGINVRVRKEPYYDPLLLRASIDNSYVVKSDNDTTILFLTKNRIGGVNAHYSISLLEVMSNIFSESRDQCREHIRSWFFNKHKINNYRQLLDYIPSELSTA
jgi:hypothetical protein